MPGPIPGIVLWLNGSPPCLPVLPARPRPSGRRRFERRLFPRSPGRAPQASACAPYRELIVDALGRGRNAMAIWQDLVIRSCGRVVSTGVFTAGVIGSASMRCSTSMRCGGKGIFQKPTGSVKRRSRLRPRGVCIRRSSLPSMGWNIGFGDSTAFAAMVRTASRGRLLCRCWRPNLHRIGLILQKRERKRQRLVA